MPISKLPSAHKSIVVHGPQGCGKTRHGERMAKHFGLDLVIEADDHQGPVPIVGALVLTCQTPPRSVRKQLTFVQAMKLLDGKPGYPF